MELFSDLRYALRQLRHSPVFLLAVVVTLAVGIGANAAMFGVIDTLLFRPPALVRDPDDLVRVHAQMSGLPGAPSDVSGVLSYPDYLDLKERATGFSSVAAFVRTSITVSDESGQSFAVPALAVTGDYFATLGVPALRGRVLSTDDDKRGGAQVVVLSHDYWRRRLGGADGILGRTIRINQHPYTVVGVTPGGFSGTDPGSVGLWLPLATASQLGFDDQLMRSRFASWLSVVARIAPGVTRERAVDAAQRAIATARMDDQSLPAPGGPAGALPAFVGEIRMALPGGERPPGAAATPPRPTVILRSVVGWDQAGMPGVGGGFGDMSVSAWTMIVSALLLLIACANVATLLVARATQRAHEIAVRLSLGATPARLVRQVVTESAVLAALGAVGGLLLGALALRVLPSVLPLPPLPGILDQRLFAFVSGTAVVAVLLFGLGPAVLTARRDLHAVLGRTTRTYAGRASGRDALVVAQLALSLLLLVGAALFVRSLQKVTAIDTGFDIDRVLVARLDERSSRMSEAEVDALWESARARLRALPTVVSTATSAAVPFQVNIMMPVVVSGHPSPDGQPRPTGAEFVGPGYFGTLGIAVLEGRGFSADDRAGTTPVAIVNTTFGRKYFGGGTVLGECIVMPEPDRPGPCVRVVGIVEDARHVAVTETPSPFVYRPFAQRPRFVPPGSVLNVRTALDARQLAGRVEREINSLQVGSAVVSVSSLFDLVAPQLLPWRIGSALFGALGSIGLLLACVGLYGVMSYVVTLRTREIGVRMALGATPGRVLAMVMRGALRLAVLGLVLGAALALFAVRSLERVIYGVRATDPLAFFVATAVLLGTALAAAFIPARRAARINPVDALRYE